MNELLRYPIKDVNYKHGIIVYEDGYRIFTKKSKQQDEEMVKSDFELFRKENNIPAPDEDWYKEEFENEMRLDAEMEKRAEYKRMHPEEFENDC